MNANNRDVDIDLLASTATCYTFRIQCGANESFKNGSDPCYLT